MKTNFLKFGLLVMIFVLISSMVVAQGYQSFSVISKELHEFQEDCDDDCEFDLDNDGVLDLDELEEREENREEHQLQYQYEVHDDGTIESQYQHEFKFSDGTELKQSLVFVNNTESFNHIEQNMLRINESSQVRLENLEDLTFVEVEGETVVLGDEEVMFLNLFRVQRQTSYHISDDGEMSRNSRAFDFMYKFQEE